MKLSSPAFLPQEKMHRRHSGEGGDVSPSLEWSFVPDHCRSFALFCEDPDAPKRPFRDHPTVHWLAYNIPSHASSLPEGLPAKERTGPPNSVTQGKNSLGHIGYSGPMPPVGHGAHHYHFRLLALDDDPNLPGGLNKEELLHNLDGHVIATAELIGLYERSDKAQTAEQEARNAG